MATLKTCLRYIHLCFKFSLASRDTIDSQGFDYIAQSHPRPEVHLLIPDSEIYTFAM